jgi:tetratricopeptide (TPR) repeat protein
MENNNNFRGKAIEGVFSSPAKSPKGKQYWLVKEISGSRAEIQPVNERLTPQGPKNIITLGQLLESFEPEPDFYVGKAYKPQAHEKPQEREQPEPTPVAAKPKNRVHVDLEGFELVGDPEEVEKNARAGFGLALAHLKRGNTKRAQEMFERLADADGDYAPAHKHMFNDFGISLRKERLAETSVKHYERAIGLSPSDENLHFNIARAYYDLREMDKATEHLEKALEMEPGLMEARMFIEYIRRKRGKSASQVRLDF